MTWAKLDDGILDNPKVAQVGALGFGWYAAGLVYCNRNLTDGFIPYNVADRLLPSKVVASDGKVFTLGITCGMQGEDLDAGRVIGWLLEAELWEAVAGGYRVHDFLDHNPSKAEVLELRAKRAEAGRRGNAASRKRAGAGASAEPAPSNEPGNGPSKSPGKIAANLHPVPGPVPEEEKKDGDARAREEDLRSLRERHPEMEPLLNDVLRRMPGCPPRDLPLVALYFQARSVLPDRWEIADMHDRLLASGHAPSTIFDRWRRFLDPKRNRMERRFATIRKFLETFDDWATDTPPDGESHDRRDPKRILGAHGTDDYAADLARTAARRAARLGAGS